LRRYGKRNARCQLPSELRKRGAAVTVVLVMEKEGVHVAFWALEGVGGATWHLRQVSSDGSVVRLCKYAGN